MAVSVTYRLLTRVGSAHSSPSILKFISHPFGGACRSYAQLSKSTNYCWKFSWWWHHRVVINKRRTFKWQPACLALLNKTLLFLNDYKTLLMNNLIWLHNLQCAFSTGLTWHYMGNRRLLNLKTNDGKLDTKIHGCVSESGSKGVDHIWFWIGLKKARLS